MTTDITVLLVEDNAGDAELVRHLVGAPDGPRHELHHVTTLAAAASALRTGEFAAVLLDLNLPDGEGIDCVRMLRRVAPTTPIVALTGYAVDEGVACIEAGAQDYLPKDGLLGEPLRRSLSYAIARVAEQTARSEASYLQVRLAAIVESSSDAIVSSTPQGVIVSWNRGAERIFGYDRSEAVGRPARDILRPVDEAGEADQQRRLENALRGVGVGEAEDLVRLRKDGSSVYLSAIVSVLHDRAGAVAGFAMIGRDVTEKKLRDEELRRQNAELSARDVQMRALTARLNAVREDERTRISREVHDELGQLLTGLKLDLAWLNRRLSAPGTLDVAALLSRVSEGTKLVDETVSCVQRIALELRPSALDTLGLQAAIRDEARRFQERSGVAMQLAVPDVAPPNPAVATALFRIFQELCTNVARHARATSVRVESRREQGTWLLEVTDDGVGLAADARQLPSSLGLLGMRERTEALGGAITFRTAPAGGTSVTIVVPLTAESTP